MNVNNKIKIIAYEFLIYILFLILYKYPLSKIYSYTGFVSNYFELHKLLIGFIFVISLILLGGIIKDQVYYFVYHTHLIMVIMPGVILYVFANASILPSVYYSFPLFLFIGFDTIKIKSKLSKISLKITPKKIKKIVIITIILMIPFFINIRNVNLSNLLFRDVYETRLMFRTSGSTIVGYLMSPLTRYVLPFIAVYALKSKRYKLLTFSVILTMIAYLTSGALKGLIFSFAFVIFFSFYDKVSSKILLFCRFFTAGIIFELGYYFLMQKELFTGYLRRALFVGPQLFDQYYNYFADNYIYYKHSRIVSMLTGDSSYRGITLWFGENVIGKEDLNASVGTFVEGFMSFGFLGVILASLTFVSFCVFYSSAKLDYAYIGLLYSATGLFKGSFFEPLLITHGLLLFIVMIIYIIPREGVPNNLMKKKSKDNYIYNVQKGRNK